MVVEKTPIPFRIKVIEPIALLPRAEREARVAKAGYNVFCLRSSDVYIDLLTDSGTAALSQTQLGRMMMGDEAYAGSESFFRLEKTIQDILWMPFVIPVHQGRAAEQLLDFVSVQAGQFVPGNAHFDTTKAHIEFRGGRAVDLTIAEGKDPTAQHPFKGNIDIVALEKFLSTHSKDQVAYILLTITCNSNGGQPVSMENIRQASEICRSKKVPLFFDAARFAENAYFIKAREKGFQNKTVATIVQEMFSYADGCTMSAKKDGLVPIGGFLALRNQKLYEELKPHDIMFEGFYTYGGMSGMDMEAMAQGLIEVVEEAYLEHRIRQVAYFGGQLKARDVPIVEPVGGHAVFIDGQRFFPKVPEDQFPAQLACVEIYKEGGVRGVEVGACLAGRDPDTHQNIRPAMDLCRLAIPRRVYTKEHLDYVTEAVGNVRATKGEMKKGLAFAKETPKGIRHFTSTFKYL